MGPRLAPRHPRAGQAPPPRPSPLPPLRVMGYVLLKLGEKTTRSSASWMNRCLLALIGNRVTNGLLTGIANRTTEVAITPKGAFLPKMLFQICLIAFPKLK